MKKRYIVCGVVQRGDKIVLGKKAQGQPPYPDVWHTPGGGVDDFDRAKDLVEAGKYNDPYLSQELQRELKEELGVSVKNIKCIVPEFRKTIRTGVTKNKHGEMTEYFFLEYLCDYDEKGEDINPSDDLAEAIWVDKNNLNHFSLTPPSEEMYKELGWLK